MPAEVSHDARHLPWKPFFAHLVGFPRRRLVPNTCFAHLDFRSRQHDVFFFGLQPRNALRSAVEACQLDAPEVAAVASGSVRGSADVVSAGFGSTSAASPSRVDGFGAPSVVASATAGAWAAAEDA